MLAQVHDRVGAEAALALRRGEPAVGAEVVVRRRQVRVVVDRDRVLAEAARRLHDQHDVAAAQGGDDDVVVAVDVQLAGRRAPVRLDALAEVVGQRVEPAARTSRPRSGSGCRRAAPRSASRGPARRPRSGRGSARRRPARRRPGSGSVRRRRSRPRPSPAAGRRRLAGVSRPTALPIRACLVGYALTASARSACPRSGCAAAGRGAPRSRRRGRRARGRRRRPTARRRRTP